MTADKKQRPIILYIALMLMFTFWALKPAVSDSEAWWLWVVRDTVEVQPAAPTDVLRGMRDNLSTALHRSEGGLKLPVAAALESWTWLAGDSLEALRWGGVLLAGLAAAVMVHLARRRVPHTTLRVLSILFVFAPTLLFLQPSDRLAYELEHQQSLRGHADPVLTFFSESSRLGYYQYRYDLRAGMGIDLGWREFTPQELIDIADKLNSTRPIWLIAPSYTHPEVLTLSGQLTRENGRQIQYAFSLGDDVTLIQFR